MRDNARNHSLLHVLPDMTDAQLLGKLILIVEDNAITAMAISEAIEEAGAEVLGPFSSMTDALEHLTEVVSLTGAILDIGLGDENSYPLANALQLARIPFIFLTGVPKVDLPNAFSHARHMMKPVNERFLLQSVAEMTA